MLRPTQEWLGRFLADPGDRRKLLLAALCGLLALTLGFWAVGVPLASRLIAFGGYYFLLGVTVAFVVQGWRLARQRGETLRGWLRHPGWVGLFLVAASAMVVAAEPFGHKILFDEYVLQATARHLHLTKQVGVPYRGYFLEGSFVPFDLFLDKRPYFFAFLGSLAHDLTGFRAGNLMYLNVAFVPVLLGLVYYLGRALSGARGGVLSVALLATLPLLGQNAAGAGMELHNLAMLALTMVASLLYLRKPDALRLSFLCLCAVLLSQSRYESVIFVGPVAVVVLLGWLKVGRPLLPWTAIIAPLLLVPYALHNRILSASPHLWQLGEGQHSRFSLSYLGGNLEGFWRFFFNVDSRGLSNSWYLSLLGFASLCALAVLAVRRLRGSDRFAARPETVCLLLFAGGVAANLGLLMFYYWARLDDPMAARFALPACLILCLAAALGVARLAKVWRPAWLAAFGGLGLFLVFSGVPTKANRLYTEYNLLPKVIRWKGEVVDSLPPKSRLVIDDRSTLPWLLRDIPSIVIEAAETRAAQVKFHLEHGTFREVLVVQALHPTSAEGAYAVDAKEVLPSCYHLELVAEKRFGVNIHRISRVVSISEIAAPSEDKAAQGEGDKGVPLLKR